MSRGNGLIGFGAGQGVVDPRLTRLSSSWVDKDLVTIRKMAAAGDTPDEIAQVLGGKWTALRVRNFIKRNKLVWNKKSVGRHLVLSASAIGGHIAQGHNIGPKPKGLLTAEKRSEVARQRYAKRRANGKAPPAKADRDKMLALIIQLHRESVLSEGQVAQATGLDRIEIRRLADVQVAA